jgi:hypothetical protein
VVTRGASPLFMAARMAASMSVWRLMSSSEHKNGIGLEGPIPQGG